MRLFKILSTVILAGAIAAGAQSGSSTPELILSNKSAIFEESEKWESVNITLTEASEKEVSFDYCFNFYFSSGVHGVYAGYSDLGTADASHTFPICNEGESAHATIPAGSTKATGIYIKPLIDGLVENNEALWLQISDLKGAAISSDYEENLGYKIFIVSNDELPTVSSALVINVNEDNSHTFAKEEFKFKDAMRTFSAVIITSLPTAGSLTLNSKAVTRDQIIAVTDLGKLVYQPRADEFGNKYATFKYKVVGSGTGDNTSKEYTATINVLPVNDKPMVNTNSNNEVVFTVMESGEISSGKIEVKDVSNEINVDTYTYSLVNVTGSDYTEFNQKFELVKDNSENITIKLKSGATLDYESKKQYVVYATVKDDAKTEKNAGVTNAGPLTSDKFKIVVNVKNVNDAPTISAQTFTMYEKQSDGSDWPANTNVGSVKASDPDGDNLTFSISTSDVPFKFKNGTNVLVVSDGSTLDYETKSTWTFKATVSDGDLTASANITVNLMDVNEPPSLASIVNEYSIKENSETGTILGTFTVSDYDKTSSSFEALTYSLSGALTGAAGASSALKSKTLADIFYLSETKNTNGTRTVAIVVKNSNLLDYESLYKSSAKNATYPATITIKDASGNSLVLSTKISVIDVNEPLTATGGTFYLQEHAPGATSVCSQKHKDGVCVDGYGQIKAVDTDIYNTSFSKLTYKISTNNTGDKLKDSKNFVIDNYGYIRTADDAEFEYDGTGAQHSYTFLVTVSDVDFTKDVEVTVKIENIEEPPNVVVADGEVVVREDARKNDAVSTITDEMLADAGVSRGDIDYYEIGKVLQDDKVSTVGKSIFDVDEFGDIYVSSTTNLDYESLSPNNKFTVQVVVKTSGSANDVIINRTLVVIDVNERPVSRDTVFNDIPEDLASGGTVGILWSTDPDSCSTTSSTAVCKNGIHPLGFNKLSYAIIDSVGFDGPDELPFEIGLRSGEITLKDGEELSYNDRDTYSFIVKISDQAITDQDHLNDPYFSNRPLSTKVKVTIKIKDMPDPPPAMSVDENSMKGTKVGVIEATDDDCKNSHICTKPSYSLEASDMAADDYKAFTIDNNGIIKVAANNILNYEMKNEYYVRVVATDGDDPTLSTATDLTININDVNDVPVYEQTEYVFEIYENAAKGELIGSVAADDEDIWTELTYTLSDYDESGDADAFTIDSDGKITLNTTLSYEKKNSYQIWATATDNGNEYGKKIGRTDFKNLSATVLVTINVIDKQTLIKNDIFVKDMFKEKNNYWYPMDFSLSESAVTEVSFDYCFEFFGDLEDAETKYARYMSTTGTFASREDLAENPTDEDDPYYMPFCKDGQTKHIVIEKGSLSPVQPPYISVNVDGMIEGDEYMIFKITNLNGAVIYGNKFDGGLLVQLQDSDNNPPQFVDLDNTKLAVPENATKARAGTIKAEDNEGDAFTYEIVGGTAKDLFDINLTTGTVTMKNGVEPFDYETWIEKNTKYTINVELCDSKASSLNTMLCSVATFTIDITDENEKPYFDYAEDEKKVIKIVENATIKDGVAVKWADLDIYDAKGKFTNDAVIAIDGDTDVFSITKSGVIVPKKTLDYETKNTYTLTLRVRDNTTDSEGELVYPDLYEDMEFSIEVVDANENPIISGDKVFSLYENKGANYIIGKLTSSDPDTAKAFTENVFAAIGGDTDLFTITEDGKIKALRDFDYEKEEKHTFELEISLSDKDTENYPNVTTTQTITINLESMPESPEITSTEFEVEENTASGTSIGFLEATDPDGDTDLLFSLADDNPFVTVSSTGEIKVIKGAKIDYETMQKFTINVSVKDVEGMSSEKDVVINVIDVNESPTITPQVFKFPEDSKPGTTKGPIEAKDPDMKNPKFSDLKSYPVEDNKMFDIEPDGDIVLKDELDYESDSTYVVKVYVTDGEFCDTTDITIKVGNVIEKSVVEITSAVVGGKTYPYPKNLVVNANKILVEWEEDGKIRSSLDTLKEGTVYIIKTYHNPTRDIPGADTVIVTYDPTASEIGEIDPSSSSSSSAKDSDKSSSSKKASSSSSSEDSEPDSSSSKGSGFKNKHFHVRMTGAFEFAIVMDEDLPSLAKQYVVMDMKGQVLSTGELSNKDTRVTVPTSGSYIVKVGLGYRRVNIQK